MFDAADFSLSLDNFSGIARLFPLPNLVLFPRVMQPLHVFEPRYRALFEEAIADDKLFALSVLAPGWEGDYDGRPPLQPIGCLCRIATHQALPDGCYNTLLIGARRIRIKRELPPAKLFREAEVELLDDVYPANGAAQRTALQRELTGHFQRALPKLGEVKEQLEQLLSQEVPLGLLTDLIAYTAQLSIEVKLQLLSETDVDARAQLLLQKLQGGERAPGVRGGRFPPDFSAN